MRRLLACLAFVALSGTASLAGETSVVTPNNQCNETQRVEAKQAVDAIKDPAKKEAASAELDTAIKFLQDNKPQDCMVHLTNALKYTTP